MLLIRRPINLLRQSPTPAAPAEAMTERPAPALLSDGPAGAGRSAAPRRPTPGGFNANLNFLPSAGEEGFCGWALDGGGQSRGGGGPEPREPEEESGERRQLCPAGLTWRPGRGRKYPREI